MKTDIKSVTRKGDPEMSTASKLAQIKSGAKSKRSTGGGGKEIVITGKDGSKIIQKQKEEKFEETAVLKKKKNYVMYEAKLGTETSTDITKIDAPMKKEKKPVRQPEPRVEEKIIQTKKKKEYLDNYQYHETKDIKNPDPRYQVYVEHQRLGDIIGGTFEETSYQVTSVKKTMISGSSSLGSSLPSTTSSKRTTTTTSLFSKTAGREPTSATGGKEFVSETSVKRRNEGTGSRTETRTQSQTTRTGGAEGSSSSTTKTTTTVTGTAPVEASSSTTTTTKTVTQTESSSGGGASSGGSSIRKKYARFSKH